MVAARGHRLMNFFAWLAEFKVIFRNRTAGGGLRRGWTRSPGSPLGGKGEGGLYRGRDMNEDNTAGHKSHI